MKRLCLIVCGLVLASPAHSAPSWMGGNITNITSGANGLLIMLDTGVTIGPEMTIATRAPGTGFGDCPRSCRTASICSSSPCM